MTRQFKKGDKVAYTMRGNQRFSAIIRVARKNGDFIIRRQFSLDDEGNEMNGTYVGGDLEVSADALAPFVPGAKQQAEEKARADAERVRNQAEEMLNTLESIIRTLEDHPDRTQANTRVHYVYEIARASAARARGEG